MTHRWILIPVTLLLLVTAVPPSRAAQEPPPDGPMAERLQERVREHFLRRLRVELALSDEQAAAMLPTVERLETERRAWAQHKRTLGRELERAYRDGASDADLQHALDAMTEHELVWHERRLELQREIDRTLSARQRVEFRLFADRFRQEVRRRMQQAMQERRRGLRRPR